MNYRILFIISIIFINLCPLTSYSYIYLQNRASYPIYYIYGLEEPFDYGSQTEPSWLSKQSEGKINNGPWCGGSKHPCYTTFNKCEQGSQWPYDCSDWHSSYDLVIFKPLSGSTHDKWIITEDGQQWEHAKTVRASDFLKDHHFYWFDGVRFGRWDDADKDKGIPEPGRSVIYQN